MTNVTGNQIGYIFQFPDAGAAARDSVVSQYFYFNMDIYDTIPPSAGGVPLNNSVTPFPGFWPMIVQPYPLVPALQTHPNLMLINNGSILQPSVIVNNGLPDLGFLMIIVQGFSVYALPGLTLQTPAPSGQSEPFPVVF